MKKISYFTDVARNIPKQRVDYCPAADGHLERFWGDDSPVIKLFLPSGRGLSAKMYLNATQKMYLSRKLYLKDTCPAGFYSDAGPIQRDDISSWRDKSL